MNIIATGTWVVCLDTFRKPSTWGCVAWSNGEIAHVRYATGAPIWDSNVWEVEYLVACESEEEAKRKVGR
jgi:hypothetical protein